MKRYLNPLVSQWIILLGALGMMGSYLGYTLYSSHQRIEQEEIARLQKQAEIVEINLNHQLTGTYDLLRSLAQGCLRGCPKVTQEHLAVVVKAIPGIRSLTLLDRDGTSWLASDPKLIGLNFSHREYFTQAQTLSDPRVLIVSPPFTATLKKWTIMLGQVMRDEQGTFQGMAIAALDQQYFSILLQSVNYAPDMWTTLAHGNGIRFVSSPEKPELTGQSLARPGSAFSRHLAGNSPHSAQINTAQTTGQTSVIVLRTIQPPELPLSAPLVITASRNYDALFADWREETAAYLKMYAALALASLLALWGYQRWQRQQQARLEEEQERNRLYLEQASDGIHILDHHGKLLTASRSFCDMLGYTPQEIIGMNVQVWDAFFPQDKIISEVLTGLLNQGRQQTFETRHRRKDGSEFPVEISVTSISMNGQRCLFASARDISERKRLEQELRLASYSCAAASDAVFWLRQDGRIYKVNDAACAMLGYRAEELEQLSLEDIDPGMNQDRHLLAWEATKQPGGYRGEHTHRHKDGHIIPIAVVANHIEVDGQEFSYSVVRDLTREKALQQHLQSAKEQAEATSAAKNEFLANISHELRTPLNGILGMAQLLEMDGINEEERKEYAKTILTSGKDLLQQLNTVLEISRIEAKSVQLKPLPFSVDSLLTDLIPGTLREAQAKGLQLDIQHDLDPTLNWLGDAGRIGQMLRILLDNAIKFTEQGTIQLSVSQPAPQALRFTVRDTGIGIAESQREKLFSAFHQQDRSLTRRHGGAGLGLTLFNSLLHLMNGTAGIESAPGMGATFWFELPLTAQPD